MSEIFRYRTRPAFLSVHPSLSLFNAFNDCKQKHSVSWAPPRLRRPHPDAACLLPVSGMPSGRPQDCCCLLTGGAAGPGYCCLGEFTVLCVGRGGRISDLVSALKH